MSFNPEKANELERRGVAFEEHEIRIDGTETNQQLPSWFKFVPEHGLKLRTDLMQPLLSDEEMLNLSEEVRNEYSPDILILSGKEDDFRSLLPEPEYPWVAGLEFVLDGKKYQTYTMNVDFEPRKNETEPDAYAYLEIQELRGHPWLDPKVTGGRKVRVKLDEGENGSRISVGLITNESGGDEPSFMIRIYLEYADS